MSARRMDMWLDDIAQALAVRDLSRRRGPEHAADYLLPERRRHGRSFYGPGSVEETSITRRELFSALGLGGLAAATLAGRAPAAPAASSQACRIVDEGCARKVEDDYRSYIRSTCRKGGKNASVGSMREGSAFALSCHLWAYAVLWRRRLAKCPTRLAPEKCPPGQVCDPSTGECRPCASNGDCPRCQTCRSGKCSPVDDSGKEWYACGGPRGGGCCLKDYVCCPDQPFCCDPGRQCNPTGGCR